MIWSGGDNEVYGMMKLGINKPTLIGLLMTVPMLCCATYIWIYTLSASGRLSFGPIMAPPDYLPHLTLGIALLFGVIAFKYVGQDDQKSRSAILAGLLFASSVILTEVVVWWSNSVLGGYVN
jgi:hypothetical protein